MIDTKYIDGSTGFEGPSKQPSLHYKAAGSDDVYRRSLIDPDGFVIQVIFNPSAGGAHTMDDITSGSLDVYVKSSVLPE